MSDSDTYLKIDTRYTGFCTCLFKKRQTSIGSFQNDIFLFRIAFSCGAAGKMVLFVDIVNPTIARFVTVSVKLVLFIVILCVCGGANGNFLGILLDCEHKTSTFYGCDISFTNFVCIACNVPCIHVLIKLRYASSFPDTFQP